jgi:hypothetical protein
VVRQKKLAEAEFLDRQIKATQISEYQRKDAEKKFNDIKNLLAKMTVPTRGPKNDGRN